MGDPDFKTFAKLDSRVLACEHRKEKEHASATRLNLIRHIEAVYAVQHKVPIIFRHCFKFSQDYFQDKSDNFLLNWFTLYKKLILEAASDPTRQQNITKFFLFFNKFRLSSQANYKLLRSKSTAALHTTGPFDQRG